MYYYPGHARFRHNLHSECTFSTPWGAFRLQALQCDQLKYRLSNFNSKCEFFRIKIQNTHFAVVWKQSKALSLINYSTNLERVPKMSKAKLIFERGIEASQRLFSHESRFEIAMKNCNCENYAVYTREKRLARVCVPCQSNMHGARVSCASVHLQRVVYRRKWLESHVAPPPKSQFRGQDIHTAISLHDLRDASLENTSGPSFELHNSNYASRCKFKPSFVWCVIWMIIQTAHFALVWKQSKRHQRPCMALVAFDWFNPWQPSIFLCL